MLLQVQTVGDGSAQPSLSQLRKDLQELSEQPGVSPIARSIIAQLHKTVPALRRRKGRGSITAATVKRIVFQFAQEFVIPRNEFMQNKIRGMCGRQVSLDHTYASVASLAAVTDYAFNSARRRKVASFGASLLTATVELGFVVLGAIVPSDAHDSMCAALCGLNGACLPDDIQHDEFAQRLRSKAAIGGPLAEPLVAIATDHYGKDKNVFERCAKPILEAKLQRGETIYSPWGVEEYPSSVLCQFLCEIN
jgi:hypothetical protein